jgi:cobyric acid synthase
VCAIPRTSTRAHALHPKASTHADRCSGALNPGGQVMGTYLHGCFASDSFRAAFRA